MRIKNNLTSTLKTIFISISILFIFQNEVKAASATCQASGCGSCPGRCATTTCTSGATFTSSICSGCYKLECYDQNSVTANSDWSLNSGESYWHPQGYDSVSCKSACDPFCTSGESCISETYTTVCNCEPEPTPTPTPSGGDGGGTTPTPPPAAPETSMITGNTQNDLSAVFSGSTCTQVTNSPLEVSGVSAQAISGSSSYNARFSAVIPSNYSITTAAGSHTVTLDLSSQTGLIKYICSCPAPNDPNNPYICSYSGITSPGSNVNFYLKIDNLSNVSWFQVFGGNVFGKTNIASYVPYTWCAADGSCQAALAVGNPGSTNTLSSGFPISNNNSVVSYNNSTVRHSYFHLPTRTANVNSYETATDMNQVSYDYFYKLAENSVQQIGNGEDLEPLLVDWTGSAWWSSSDINYIRVDGNVSIDETQGFNLSSGQKLVVFVDGNLTIDDSNPNDSNRKITSVANGGFLAFFASGNILITPNVGYELNPSVPTVPTVSNANSNVEGVFVASNDLIIQTKSAIGEVPPDRKFIGAGTFVGWHRVSLNRTFDDNNLGPILNNNQAIDNFVYRPDLLANWPTKLKSSISNWREVDPQLINQ